MSLVNSKSDPSELGRTLAAFTKEAIEGSLDFDTHPNSAISVHIKVLESGKNVDAVTAACITASSLALRDAGITTSDTVLGVCISPDSGTAQGRSASLAMSIKDKQVRFLNLSGVYENGTVVDSLINVGESIVGELGDRLGLREVV
jgi:ribonuclease PH